MRGSGGERPPPATASARRRRPAAWSCRPSASRCSPWRASARSACGRWAAAERSGAGRGERTGTPPAPPAAHRERGGVVGARAAAPRSPWLSPGPRPLTPAEAAPAPARGWRAGDTRVTREVVRGGGGPVAAGVQPLCRMSAGDTKRESPSRRGFGKAPVTQFPQPRKRSRPRRVL